MLRLLAILVTLSLLGAAVTGCTSLQDSAKLENWSGSGLNPGDDAFPGILSGSRGPQPAVRYVFHTHGMGLTDQDAVLIRPMTVALQAAGYILESKPGGSPWIEAPTVKTHQFEGEGFSCEGGAALQPPCSYDRFGRYRIDRFIHRNGRSRVVVYSYFWHADLWELQKPFLAHDLAGMKSGFDGWTPGVLTGSLKTGIVDEGLSDVAAYLGPAGQALREGMSSAVCVMLREASGNPVTAEDHDQRIALSPSECLDDASAQSLLESNVRISFISHSLGSRMLFDVLSAPTIRAIKSDPRAADDKSLDNLNAMAMAYSAPTKSLLATRQATDTFYMAANQLSLLGVARITRSATAGERTNKSNLDAQRVVPDPACPSALPGFITARCRLDATTTADGNKMKAGLSSLATNALAEKRGLTVVGFFDPGDVLGFSLMGGRAGREPADVRFVSVLHRNTPQILMLGSNPMVAHDSELALETLARPGAGQPRHQDAPPYRRDRPTDVFRSPNATAMIFCGATSNSGGRLTPRKCLSAEGP